MRAPVLENPHSAAEQPEQLQIKFGFYEMNVTNSHQLYLFHGQRPFERSNAPHRQIVDAAAIGFRPYRTGQSLEEEEGVFLQTAIMSGLLAHVEPTEQERKDFERRAARYIERFPNSTYFGSIPLPTDGGGDAFLKAL